MPQLEDALDDMNKLAQTLRQTKEPIMLRRAGEGWRVNSLAALLELYGDDEVKVVTSGGVYRGEAKVETLMRLRDFGPSTRNGTLPPQSYVFADLSTLQLAECASEARDLFARVSMLRDPGYVAVPSAARGRPILSLGGWGHGRPFHAHGPALNGLASGVKHWFVRRPNATEKITIPSGLQGGAALAAGWATQLWQCTQRAGDVLWVPDRYEHATANFADDTASIFTVIDDVSERPLHSAAKRGDEAAVRALLDPKWAYASSAEAVGARTSSGGTALAYAAGAGAVGVMRALLGAGADLSAAANSGATALHAAAFGGHAEAATLLVGRGADVGARDANGKTALDLAEQLGHADVWRVLSHAAREAAGAGAAPTTGSKLASSRLAGATQPEPQPETRGTTAAAGGGAGDGGHAHGSCV